MLLKLLTDDDNYGDHHRDDDRNHLPAHGSSGWLTIKLDAVNVIPMTDHGGWLHALILQVMMIMPPDNDDKDYHVDNFE